MTLCEDTMRYLYLPSLRARAVLQQPVSKGAATRGIFGTAYGNHEGKHHGFKLGGSNIQFDSTVPLTGLEAAKASALASRPPTHAADGTGPSWGTTNPPAPGTEAGSGSRSKSNPPPGAGVTPSPGESKFVSLMGTVDVKAPTAKMRLVQIDEKILHELVSDSRAVVLVTVVISAESSNGVSDQVKCTVFESAKKPFSKQETLEW